VSEVPLEIRVRREIWGSFVSLLNSYAAAGGPDYSVEKVGEWVGVVYKGRAIRFRLSPATGEVLAEGAFAGRFQVNQDGTFGIDGVDQPIDLAAIDWIAALQKEQQFDDSLLETNLESSHEPRDRDHL
jgi:hypothetical protein